MTERDIVYELREIQRMNTTLHGAQMAARAADEIERLRAERDGAWKTAMQKAERDMAELRDQLEVEENAVNHLHTDRNNLRLEVERLRAERDEARREVCESDTKTHGGALLEAERRGWDCFEEKP